MALRGDYLLLKTRKSGSATVIDVIADTTSVTVDFSAEALETTSQDSGLHATFIPGKVTGTISGDFLKASSSGDYEQLFALMNAGSVVEFEVWTGTTSTEILDGTAVITSLSVTGGDSSTLVTGAFSLQISGSAAA